MTLRTRPPDIADVAPRGTSVTMPETCGGCSSETGTVLEGTLFSCDGCGGIVGTIEEHRVGRYVMMGTLADGDGVRYFDIKMTYNAQGDARRSHGWINANGVVVQYG